MCSRRPGPALRRPTEAPNAPSAHPAAGCSPAPALSPPQVIYTAVRSYRAVSSPAAERTSTCVWFHWDVIKRRYRNHRIQMLQVLFCPVGYTRSASVFTSTLLLAPSFPSTSLTVVIPTLLPLCVFEQYLLTVWDFFRRTTYFCADSLAVCRRCQISQTNHVGFWWLTYGEDNMPPLREVMNQHSHLMSSGVSTTHFYEILWTCPLMFLWFNVDGLSG